MSLWEFEIILKNVKYRASGAKTTYNNDSKASLVWKILTDAQNSQRKDW